MSTRWIIKALGFSSTIIMARLLAPEDYGLVAMATLLVGLIQTLLDFGASTAILRNPNLTQVDIDSAWTLRLGQSVAIALLICGLSPLLATLFEDPRLIQLLLILAGCVVISGLANMAQTLCQKEYQFRTAFKIDVLSKVASIGTTLAVAQFIQDYRALIFGITAGYIASMVLGYLLHPHRPRFETSKIPAIWAVTKWLMVANIGGYILTKGDELIAAKTGTPHDYGNYNVGADLGQLPIQEVGPATLRALLPVLSELAINRERLLSATIKTSRALNTIIWPIGLGFFAIAADATMMMLGPKWHEASIYVALFALVATLQTAAQPLLALMTIDGATKQHTHLAWGQFAAFVVATAALLPSYGLVGLAVARLVASCTCLAHTIWLARSVCGLAIKQSAFTMVRPALCAAIMMLAVSWVTAAVSGAMTSLLVAVPLGVVVYTATSWAAWTLTDKPEGLESTVVDLVQSYLRKRRT